jgi:hypothetical protein
MNAAAITFGRFSLNEKDVYISTDNEAFFGGREWVGSIYRASSRRYKWSEYTAWIWSPTQDGGERELVSRTFWGGSRDNYSGSWRADRAGETFSSGPAALAAAKRWAKATATN